jgi:hypothetical protein
MTRHLTLRTLVLRMNALNGPLSLLEWTVNIQQMEMSVGGCVTNLYRPWCITISISCLTRQRKYRLPGSAAIDHAMRSEWRYSNAGVR